ncbi:hypothetical protein [Vibrio sp. WXL103]|uniref:hypothetical protein n=1 Tax=unclassified Vibrio TaxID=2614977 RepID=UPI003EC4BFBF
MTNIIHVAKHGSDTNSGCEDAPFATISHAARIAEAGDTVLIDEGVYREWVRPQNSGTTPCNRITYQAKDGAKVVIKGSEVFDDWQHVEGSVWKTQISNQRFEHENPYEKRIFGDWFVYPQDFEVHTGDVYLNGRSLFEARSLEEVKNPQVRTSFNMPLSDRVEQIHQPETTIYVWYVEVDDEYTTIYANFHQYDPNQEFVEVNIRPCCFYPDKRGVNYITVSGLEMCHAATPWTPPTADQPGLIGTHWSKGWVIENNIIHDSKCSAISLGKESSTGDNFCARYQHKSGYQNQLESVFKAIQLGWSKETIGSHIVRNNTIYDCGQNGIVGHMGCAFSEIYANHIYNIGTKHEFFGWEIAAIKFHAPIDTVITKNRIHDCTLGIWLDWQVQGARVSQNLLYRNDRDCTIEVTHGPLLVDNNIFASEYNLDNHAQGTAFVNNLFCGVMSNVKVLDRATPYHFPHSTSVAGYAFTYGGDDRYYNNIFVGTENNVDKLNQGTCGYNQNHSNYESYLNEIISKGNLDEEKYVSTQQPVYIDNNVYYNGSASYQLERSKHVCADFNPDVTVIEDNDNVYLQFDADNGLLGLKGAIHSTYTLGQTRLSEGLFETTDGQALTLDSDFFDNARTPNNAIGPFATLTSGINRFKVW